MAQVAVESAVSGGALIGRPAEVQMMKRKTPSELRGEQLKRRTSEKIANDQFHSDRGIPSQDVLLNNEKAPRSADAEATSPFVPSSVRGDHGNSAKLDSSVPSLSEAEKPGFRKAEKCSENALRSVSELHVGDEKQAGSNKFDMEKVMKGFGARDASGASYVPNVQGSDVPLKSSEACPSKITIPGKRAPLDLTLKTMQFVSSSSVKWCHNLCMGSIAGHIAQNYHDVSQHSRSTRPKRNKEFLFSRALQSWVYPQSLLPASFVSAMLSSTARGENEFLNKRYQDWEDSFKNLYFMLRKNFLNIFYVYTAQFVALFIRGNCLEKQPCSAYLSQSTRGIRSLLEKMVFAFLCLSAMLKWSRLLTMT